MTIDSDNVETGSAERIGLAGRVQSTTTAELTRAGRGAKELGRQLESGGTDLGGARRRPMEWGVAVAQAVALDVCGGRGQCRRAAIGAALEEVSAAMAARDEPVLALRCYQPGGLIAALGGRFDAAAVDRLAGRAAELRARAHLELVLECSGLETPCGSRLPRVLAQLRMRCLVDGAHVELHHAPAELLVELGQPCAQSYTVTDDTPDAPQPVERRRPRAREGVVP